MGANRWEEAWGTAIKWGRKNLKTLKKNTIEQASQVQRFMNPENLTETTVTDTTVSNTTNMGSNP